MYFKVNFLPMQRVISMNKETPCFNGYKLSIAEMVKF